MIRATKQAIAAALRDDPAVAELVPAGSVYAVELATIPQLPSIEVIAISSERIGDGPMVRHTLAVESTVSHRTEDGADELLDGIVLAVRRRLSAAERSNEPIGLSTREGVLVELGGVRWSVSARGAKGVIRGASISVNADVAER